ADSGPDVRVRAPAWPGCSVPALLGDDHVADVRIRAYQASPLCAPCLSGVGCPVRALADLASGRPLARAAYRSACRVRPIRARRLDARGLSRLGAAALRSGR